MNDTNSPRNPLTLGGHFELDGESFTTKSYISLESLLATRASDGETVKLSIEDIVRAFGQKADNDDVEHAGGAEALNQSDWDEAVRRHGKLKILIEAASPTRKMAAEIAKDLGRSIATIYRWRAVFLAKGAVSELAPHHPDGGRGGSRIDSNANAILEEVLEEFYLTNQKRKPSQILTELELRCKRARVKCPHINTVRRRIAQISPQTSTRAREGRTESRKLDPAPGRFPGADYPNAVWQIDHTPVDICIVDDVYRKNIGRAWITVAIDVYSRCVVGFYLSLDKPNAAAVGMCLVQAILPKGGWLAAHGIKASWPIWGRPRKVHADNDKTFRCEMVTRAAKQYGIDLEWRRVKTPHWGGHIERLLGTFNQEIHTLPGTTFSNPSERGDYKPHEKAELTFGELERYVAEYLCGTYHHKFHTRIKRSPIKRYETGLLGDGVNIGPGLPEPEKDPDRLRLDFLPLKQPTVQQYGIVWDNITYYDPLIDHWIRSEDPKTGKRRKFICRRDPRDISVVWFLDPEKDCYFKLPYRNVEHPSINLWELREVRAQLTRDGLNEINEELIFESYERLKSIRTEASQATQAARKANQKKANHKRSAQAENAQLEQAKAVQQAATKAKPAESVVDAWDDDEVVAVYSEPSAA